MKKFFLRNYKWDNGIERAAQELTAGKHRHDVLEAAVRATETDESIDSIGYGGFPNILGEMELDAAFMNGDGRQLGCVAAVKHYLPVRIARKLMETGLHTLLVGDGAERFASESGLRPEATLSAAQRKAWEGKIKPKMILKHGNKPLINLVRDLSGMVPAKRDFDTVVMAASDGTGVSAATSTSGWPYKHRGRVGDSSISGGGFYVDSRFGACACTYTGEMSMRAGTARYVVAQLESGKDIAAAVDAAVEDVKVLKGGVLGTLVIHAIDRDGNARAVAINPEEPEINYWYWNEDMPKPERRVTEVIRT
jgi:L-asparaginase